MAAAATLTRWAGAPAAAADVAAHAARRRLVHPATRGRARPERDAGRSAVGRAHAARRGRAVPRRLVGNAARPHRTESAARVRCRTAAPTSCTSDALWLRPLDLSRSRARRPRGSATTSSTGACSTPPRPRRARRRLRRRRRRAGASRTRLSCCGGGRAARGRPPTGARRPDRARRSRRSGDDAGRGRRPRAPHSTAADRDARPRSTAASAQPSGPARRCAPALVTQPAALRHRRRLPAARRRRAARSPRCARAAARADDRRRQAASPTSADPADAAQAVFGDATSSSCRARRARPRPSAWRLRRSSATRSLARQTLQQLARVRPATSPAGARCGSTAKRWASRRRAGGRPAARAPSLGRQSRREVAPGRLSLLLHRPTGRAARRGAGPALSSTSGTRPSPPPTQRPHCRSATRRRSRRRRRPSCSPSRRRAPRPGIRRPCSTSSARRSRWPSCAAWTAASSSRCGRSCRRSS